MLDDVTVTIPDRPGNRRVDGFHNLLTNPHIGLVFLIPGRDDTLRVNGTARLMRDVPYAEQPQVKRHVPNLVLEVDVTEVFTHCPKAFLRSAAWKPETWHPEEAPRHSVFVQSQQRPEDSLATLDDYYGPSSAKQVYG